MMKFLKVPQLSRPYMRAAVVDAFGMGILLGAIQPFAGVLARRLGATPEMLGLMSVAPFLGFLTSALISRLMFRVRWGILLSILRVLPRLALVSFALIQGPASFVGLILILQVVSGWSMLVSSSLLKAHVYERVRAGLLKWLRVLNVLVAVPVTWGVGKILDVNAEVYRSLWPAVGVLGALSAVLYFWLPRRVTETRALAGTCSFLEELRTLRKDRRYLVFMCAFFVGTLGEKIGMPVTPMYFADVLNLKYQEVAAVGVIGPILGVAGYLVWGRFLKRTKPLTILTVCMFVKALRPLLWALAPRISDPIGYIVAGEALFRFMVSGLEMAMLLSVLEMSRNRQTPVYMGIHFLFLGIRGILGPFLGVSMIRLGLPIADIYWVIATIVALGGFSLLAFMRWDKAAKGR